MDLRLASTWDKRDLPVLLETAKRLHEDPWTPVQAEDLIEATSLDLSAVAASLIDLGRADYIDCSKPQFTLGGGIPFFQVNALTERGRRSVGLWPAGEAADALVNALRQAEAQTSDPDEKTAIRRAAGAVMGVGRDVMTDVLAAVISQQVNA